MFKLYFSIWTYASITELINIAFACTSYIIIEFTYKFVFNINMPRSSYLIKLMLLIMFVSGVRFAYRILRTLRGIKNKRKNNINTMIIGAGDAGRLLITEIYNNPTNFGNRVVCVIDDNRNKVGSYIRGIPVVGNSSTIEENCEKYGIQEIIIAIPSASKQKISSIVDECQKTKCNIRILPNVSEMIGKPSMTKVRPLSYEDFLGRSQVVVDVKEIASNITDKVILVTGGGGSIGSELCRQIAKCEPKHLIIFEPLKLKQIITYGFELLKSVNF